MSSIQRKLSRRLKSALAKNDLATIKNLIPSLDKVLEKPHNLVLLGDAYKYSHQKFYLPNTDKIGSYMESRGGKYSYTVTYGIQQLMKRYLSGVAIIAEDVDEAYEYLGTKLGTFGRDDVFDRSKFDYIVEKHGGRLPIRIKAVPEGTCIDTGNVLLYIENTDPECSWLTNFLETLILQVWYPITVATLSREVKKVANQAFLDTTDYDQDTIDSMLDFVLNDFGFRGASSVESAAIGGSAHLVNFRGSDNTVASKLIRENYNTDTVYNLSIPATEHSIMCMKGKAGEVDMMRRVLEQYPTGMVACVSDTYGIVNAVKNIWGNELKDLILSRPAAPGNALVIRPDSGHVINTLTVIFEHLFDIFGYTVNSKGYKVLPPQIRVIQGDGVNPEAIADIYDFLRTKKISAENIVFGMGGKLLQSGISRDTQAFATKACFAIIDGEERDIVKEPIEIDEHFNEVPSFKKSKQGIPKLVINSEGQLVTVTPKDPYYETYTDELVTVFENGELLVEYTFEEIRDRASIHNYTYQAMVTLV